jgi:hypothetical protein
VTDIGKTNIHTNVIIPSAYLSLIYIWVRISDTRWEKKNSHKMTVGKPYENLKSLVVHGRKALKLMLGK